ncbi:MAG: elongation factor P hydroxylase [Oleiphilus sp.]
MLQEEFDVAVLERLFNCLFSDSEKTLLCSGAEEPIYLPAQPPEIFNKIISTKDYFSSALHEISHWCVAGKLRRKQVDYGYWYEPDGRTAEQQRLFEQVEVKPQALEWIFSQAAGVPFRLSVDNVNQPELGASEVFKINVHAQVLDYLSSGLPSRANVFLNALLAHYQPKVTHLSVSSFQLSML